jgi:hypothetical protein
METQTITAVYDHLAEAESAVGRLEVAGVPVTDITVQRTDLAGAGTDGTVVTASVETRLIEKAMGIMTGEGRVEVPIASRWKGKIRDFEYLWTHIA